MDVALDTEELADALRAGAKGLYPAEAAVGLLIEHGSWLRRDDFAEHIDTSEDGSMAWVDWQAVLDANLPASGGERRMLYLAAGLAGRPWPDGEALGDQLGNLDDENLRRVLGAVLHAARGASGLPVSVEPFWS